MNNNNNTRMKGKETKSKIRKEKISKRESQSPTKNREPLKSFETMMNLTV